MTPLNALAAIHTLISYDEKRIPHPAPRGAVLSLGPE